MPRFHRTEQKTSVARDLRATASRSERRLWLYLRAGGAGASFRRQHPIGPFFADYACPSLKIVVEVDGHLHDAARDRRRDGFMKREGWLVLRFNAEAALNETSGCFAAICNAVRARRYERGVH